MKKILVPKSRSEEVTMLVVIETKEWKICTWLRDA